MLKNRKIQLLILIVLLIIVTTFFIIKNVIYKPKAKNSKEQYNNIKSNNIETTNVVEKSVISKEDLLKNINYAEKEIKEDELLNKLKNLEIYAIEFKEENNVNTSIVELCLQYIRKDKYNSDAWKITAGNINEEFVKYVNEKSKELSNYNFQNAKIPNANIDFVHMCASLNAIIYNSKIIPSEYSGWAGDLVTLMGQIIKYDENKTNNELIKYGNSLIGANSTNTLFNEKDMQADVDSINLSKQISNSFYIEIINYYYKENDVRKNNMRDFKKYLLEKENSQTIYEAVKNNFSKNKVYINALINSLTNSNIAQKYKENQEKYIEIMAQIFENYFLKNL
ncbi:MAG: hypothetical protein ACLURX_06665 [Clostridia bacterium]